MAGARLVVCGVAGLLVIGCGERGGSRTQAVGAAASASAPAPASPTPTPTPTPTATATVTAPAAVPAASAAVASAPLLIPVAGVSAAMLRDSFDEMRGSARHEALDIMAPRGTPVLAVADGRVVKLFNSRPGGLTVYQFDSSRTLAYYYAHLDRYADGLQEGALVRRGQPIGSVGSSGNASPEAPHLHFAVFVLGPQRQWWQGTPVNPYPLFTGPPAAPLSRP